VSANAIASHSDKLIGKWLKNFESLVCANWPKQRLTEIVAVWVRHQPSEVFFYFVNDKVNAIDWSLFKELLHNPRTLLSAQVVWEISEMGYLWCCRRVWWSWISLCNTVEGHWFLQFFTLCLRAVNIDSSRSHLEVARRIPACSTTCLFAYTTARSALIIDCCFLIQKHAPLLSTCLLFARLLWGLGSLT
jgi:hypothetical protein